MQSVGCKCKHLSKGLLLRSTREHVMHLLLSGILLEECSETLVGILPTSGMLDVIDDSLWDKVQPSQLCCDFRGVHFLEKWL